MRVYYLYFVIHHKENTLAVLVHRIFLSLLLCLLKCKPNLSQIFLKIVSFIIVAFQPTKHNYWNPLQQDGVVKLVMR